MLAVRSRPGCSGTAPGTPEGLAVGRRQMPVICQSRVVAGAGSSLYSRLGTVADQAVRAGRFLVADLIGLLLGSVPLRGTARVKDIAPKDRGLAGGQMSRSTASPPPERGVPSEGRPPRERSDDHERQVMRLRHVSASFAWRADGAQERVVNVCARRPPPDQPAHKPFGGALRC